MRQAASQRNPDRHELPDLATQLESLLDTVWRCERMWNLHDRMDRQIRWDERKK
jgi:hypothetical protein